MALRAASAPQWARWGWSPGPAAREADAIPLHHAPLLRALVLSMASTRFPSCCLSLLLSLFPSLCPSLFSLLFLLSVSLRSLTPWEGGVCVGQETPPPGTEPGSSARQAEILTTILQRTCRLPGHALS